ncbi:hypothetical protein C8R45DRAFT_934366 [Mycena sanguinolenta]|nr:hypothetical protein C8R45DRAFT_934366 [Mycena sanguinolenta]
MTSLITTHTNKPGYYGKGTVEVAPPTRAAGELREWGQKLREGAVEEEVKRRRPTEETVSCIMYTSGSTGAEGWLLRMRISSPLSQQYTSSSGTTSRPRTRTSRTCPLTHILEFIVGIIMLFVGMPTRFLRVKFFLYITLLALRWAEALRRGGGVRGRATGGDLLGVKEHPNPLALQRGGGHHVEVVTLHELRRGRTGATQRTGRLPCRAVVSAPALDNDDTDAVHGPRAPRSLRVFRQSLANLLCSLFAPPPAALLHTNSPLQTLTDASVCNCDGDIKAFRPSIMVGVPAVWETIRKGIIGQAVQGGKLKECVFKGAVEAKKRRRRGGGSVCMGAGAAAGVATRKENAWALGAVLAVRRGARKEGRVGEVGVLASGAFVPPSVPVLYIFTLKEDMLTSVFRRGTLVLGNLADSMILSSVQAATGGRLRIAMSGGATIGRETQEFLSVALVMLFQGMGKREGGWRDFIAFNGFGRPTTRGDDSARTRNAGGARWSCWSPGETAQALTREDALHEKPSKALASRGKETRRRRRSRAEMIQRARPVLRRFSTRFAERQKAGDAVP